MRASSALIFSALARPVGDLLPPRLEHLQDRLVGEPVEHGADDAEADDLRQQVRPVDAERPGDLLELAAALRRDQQVQDVMHRRVTGGPHAPHRTRNRA